MPNTPGRPCGSRAGIVCRFYAQGNCARGQNCAFSHDLAGLAKTRETMSVPVELPVRPAMQIGTRALVPCRFFVKGSCTKGSKCPFAHINDDMAQTSPLETDGDSHQRIEDQNLTELEIHIREIGGARVSFGDGAVVSRVVLVSDLSAVRISHLPSGTTTDSVSQLMSGFGFNVSTDCIRVRLGGKDAACSAEIRVEDPNFAKDIYTAMRSKGDWSVTVINASLSQAAASRRVDAKKVRCSWHAPCRSAWLNCRTASHAHKLYWNYLECKYKVLGQKVTVDYPCLSDRGSSWMVRLRNLPVLASKESHLLQDVPIQQLPLSVGISDPTYTVDLPEANAIVESMLLQAGPLEQWHGSSETSGKRFKATARYINEVDARHAVTLCNNKPLSFNEKTKLTVQLVYSARLKVSASIYNVVEPEINIHKQGWLSLHLVYCAYPSSNGFRVLKIEGEVSDDVAKAKATLERIFDGGKPTADGASLWTNSFMGNGSIDKKLQAIERDLDVVIVRDKRKCQIRVFGPSSRYSQARQALIDLAKQDSSSAFVIELDADGFAWAFKGGYHAIADAIGRERVTMDIISQPRRIVVTGNVDCYKTARDIFDRRVAAQAPGTKAGPLKECAVCWTEAEDPIQTACKHDYCSECFQDLCLKGLASNEPQARIRCLGNGGACQECLPITEIHEHLSSAAFEEVLENSFTAYIARHPTNLRHCPTPDCDQVYRVANPSASDTPPLFTCAGCMATVCTACHVLHDGLTCAEHRDHATGGYQALQKAKVEMGIKDCPVCGTMLQKSEGCNHMTCGACRAHICWVCMETFPEGGLVYSHMQRKHGGIGLPYYPDMA